MDRLYDLGGVVAVVLGGLAFLSKVLIPKMFQQFDSALAAFREELASEREARREEIRLLALEIKGVRDEVSKLRRMP